MYENEVSPAFEILLEEIETIIDRLDQEGAKLFSRSAHKEARLLLDKAESANLFRTKIKELQKEWFSLEAQITRKTPAELQHSRRNKSRRLQRGLRTPEEDYRLPILGALVRLGGKSSSNNVLDQVGKVMGDALNKYDKEHLVSTPSLPRWRNTAQWARNGLVNEGLLSKNSPKGIWEITEAGRKALPTLDKNIEQTGVLPSKKDIPAALYYVLRVYKCIVGETLSYNEAVTKVAKEERLKSVHTVYDACTRRIKLNTEQFRMLLENHQGLIGHLVTQYPKQEAYIKRTIM